MHLASSSRSPATPAGAAVDAAACGAVSLPLLLAGPGSAAAVAAAVANRSIGFKSQCAEAACAIRCGVRG